MNMNDIMDMDMEENVIVIEFLEDDDDDISLASLYTITNKPTSGAGAAANATVKKGKLKKKNDDFIMPTRENHSMLLSNKYTIKQLKDVASHYKIKLGGDTRKSDMITKIYNYFKLFDKAVIIQKMWRTYLFHVYNKLKGPARFNRGLCVNETDFFTMDDLTDIPYTQFFSYEDVDKKIYGFDIMSLYNLFDKSCDVPVNPYNRNAFPKQVKKNMMRLIRLSHIYNDTIEIQIKNEEVNENEQSIEQRTMTVFHDIDILGNYTNYMWFLTLERSALIRFLVELNDIWSYRANLSDEVKREISPNYYALFSYMTHDNIYGKTTTMLYHLCLKLIEGLVRPGINADSRSLGANLVLCALTLVSVDAAIELPWLYQSVI
jgi:hypothetical protein